MTLLNMQFCGVRTFTNKVSYQSLLNSDKKSIMILAIIVPIQIIFMFAIVILSFWKKSFREKEYFKNMIPLFAYSIGSLFVIFPIADKMHFSIGIICTNISFIYFLYVFINKFLKEEKYKQIIGIYTKSFGTLIILFLAGISAFQLVDYAKSENKSTDHKHFNNILINKDFDLQITKVDEYIKQKEEEGKTAYLLDFAAAMYMIPLDRYNKDYDMFDLGNFGAKGNKGVIEDIKQKKNAIFLIASDEYDVHWQHPIEITDYVKENYKKIDSVAIFDVYEKTE